MSIVNVKKKKHKKQANSTNNTTCSSSQDQATTKVAAPLKDIGKFYSDGAHYWETIDPTVDGMLGGLETVNETDIISSKRFLSSVIEKHSVFSLPRQNEEPTRALDCGAGIGRITKQLLLPTFDFVDLVEQDKHFLDQAPAFIGASNASRVQNYFCSGLQGFTPEPKHYNVIWVQWVLGHLTDPDLISFFSRCTQGLKPNGLICVKENIAPEKRTEFDETDSSYTRPRNSLVRLLTRAGLDLLCEEKQVDFPSGLYEVRSFALRPSRNIT